MHFNKKCKKMPVVMKKIFKMMLFFGMFIQFFFLTFIPLLCRRVVLCCRGVACVECYCFACPHACRSNAGQFSKQMNHQTNPNFYQV